jgi:hypothetical protein
MRTGNTPTTVNAKHQFPTMKTSKPRHAPPNHADLRPLDLPLRTVNIRDSLPEVELCVFLGGDAFDLDEGGVRACVALGAFVPKDAALGIESGMKGWSACSWEVGKLGR